MPGLFLECHSVPVAAFRFNEQIDANSLELPFGKISRRKASPQGSANTNKQPKAVSLRLERWFTDNGRSLVSLLGLNSLGGCSIS